MTVGVPLSVPARRLHMWSTDRLRMAGRRRGSGVQRGLCAVVLSLMAVAFAAASATEVRAGPPLNAYRGLGSWIDIYDPSLWRDPVGGVREAARHGVRTLFVETANYHAPTAVFKPAELAQLIEAAHARGMKVVAWYLPGFRDLRKDLKRCRAAIDFRTPSGQRFDSFALDIEASIVTPASTRSRRLITLSARLRRAVGDKYPLGAIIPSPVGMRLHASYWPGFPYKRLPQYYDVIVPMGYFTFHVQGAARTYAETRENIRIVRERTGRPTIPLHLIGGLAAAASGPEVRAFVRAAREYGIMGASLYDLSTTASEDWRQLRLVRANPLQRPALPLTTRWDRALGYLPRGDRRHPKEVFYETAGLSAGVRLRYRVFDCQRREIRLIVNWHDAGPVPTGRRDGWSALRTLTLPPSVLHPSGRNTIAFVARGGYPQWTRWGVKDVSLVP